MTYEISIDFLLKVNDQKIIIIITVSCGVGQSKDLK